MLAPARGHVRERVRCVSAAIRAPVRPRRRARRDDLLPRPLPRPDPPASTGRVRVHRKVAGASELAGLARAQDGTLYAADLPSGRILRIPRSGPVVSVATVPMPVDLVVDPPGSTLWVASIAEGVGLVRVDVASGSVEPFAAVRQPHGVAQTVGGDFVVHDGHAVSRVDGDDGRRDAAREGRRVQGRRRPERCCLRSDGWAERRPRRAHLAERSGRARRRNGPARPAPRRAGTGSADAPERRRARPRTGPCSSRRSSRCRRSGASTSRPAGSRRSRTGVSSGRRRPRAAFARLPFPHARCTLSPHGRHAERRRNVPLHRHRGLDAARQATSRALRQRAGRSPAPASCRVRRARRLRGRHAGRLVLRRVRERARGAPRRRRGPARAASRTTGRTAWRSRCGWACTRARRSRATGATPGSPFIAPRASAPPGTAGRSSSRRRPRPCSRTRRRTCTSSSGTSVSSASRTSTAPCGCTRPPPTDCSRRFRRSVAMPTSPGRGGGDRSAALAAPTTWRWPARWRSPARSRSRPRSSFATARPAA